jgi:hypothetical protein
MGEDVIGGRCSSWQAMVSVKNFHRSARARPPPADTQDQSSAATTSQVTPSIQDFAVSLVRHLTRNDGYTTRQASYDRRKLRGKGLADKPGRTRRYYVPPRAARTIAALLALRDHVIAPILAGVRSPRMGRKPAHWTRVDRDYEALRVSMQELFRDVGIDTLPTAA